MGERKWECRRRWPEETLLYEAVRDHLATLLKEARWDVACPVRGAGLHKIPPGGRTGEKRSLARTRAKVLP
jgi:hypothetical protein